MTARHTIVICMGSSCFARGNRKHLELIERFLERRNLRDEVVVEGSHCEEHCAEGPNIRIDGHLYQHMDAGMLLDVLESHFSVDSER